MPYVNEAFHLVCKNARSAEEWYVCLVATNQSYGGPEEGGWWYDVRTLEAYQAFSSKDEAEIATEQVQKLARELRLIAQRAHGDYCQRTMEWLEERGLDADFLPEPDGPVEYYVCMCKTLPVFDNRRPYYC